MKSESINHGHWGQISSWAGMCILLAVFFLTAATAEDAPTESLDDAPTESPDEEATAGSVDEPTAPLDEIDERAAQGSNNQVVTTQAKGFTSTRIRQVIFILIAFALCSGWFTLISTAQHRYSGDSKKLKMANTINFFTFGLGALPVLLKSNKSGEASGHVTVGSGDNEKGGKKGEEVSVVFLNPDGQKRKQGLGEAVTTSHEIIANAVVRGATDIHLEPKGQEIQVRFRVDGEMFTAMSFHMDLAAPLVASLKVVSDLDISERRKPQDGSFQALINAKPVDFRVSTAPSNFGEKMVIRVLDKSAGIKRLEDLGFTEKLLENVRSVVLQPHGMLIVCGPTGSGKSTTLYAALSEIDASTKNIITIEDPIEYQLSNVTQTAVNTKAGVTFASVLRSCLRQDPDVLMVGEVRDSETAQVAMQAAMTGHLVFTTLHANESVSSVFRLLDLGLEPFMVSSALSGVLAQRLVRMLCSDCKEAYSPKPEFIQLAQKKGINVNHFFKPVGCEVCGGSGYKGRVGVHELLIINDTIRTLIQSRPKLTELQEAAKKSGINYLREDALIKAAHGLTSVEQVLSLVTK